MCVMCNVCNKPRATIFNTVFNTARFVNVQIT